MGALTFPGPDWTSDSTPAEKRAHDRAWKRWVREENARIARQRIITSMRGPSARRRLHRALLDRAWALLDAGECGAADELLEFVPEPMATALLDKFFGEDA